MNLRKAAQQALEALESVFEGEGQGAEFWSVTGGTYEAVECMQAMRALRAALAEEAMQRLTDVQQEMEPVAKFCKSVPANAKPNTALAEAYRCGYEFGVAEEREACAQSCAKQAQTLGNREKLVAGLCAAAIRERENK